MSQKIKTILLGLILVAVGCIFCMGQAAIAAPSDNTSTGTPCPAGQANSTTSGNCLPIKTNADCPATKVDPKDKTKCQALGNDCSSGTAEGCLKNNPIINDLNNIIKVFSALVGIVVIGMIIVGGIQYAIAGDNPTGVTAAKHRIINALIALAVYIFMLAFLQWLIPGGIV